jgi:hypothetical protein
VDYRQKINPQLVLVVPKEKIVTISKNKRQGIGVFPHKQDAEAALHQLRDSGFPMDRVSVIAKDDGEESVQGKDLSQKPGHPVGKGAQIGSVTGTVIGLVTGLLAGVSTVILPGIGSVVVAGSIGEIIGITLAGGGAGAIAGGLVGTFTSLGIPGDRAKVYSDRLARGDYLVVVEGTGDELMRAEMILLNDRGIEEWSIYDAHQPDPAIAEGKSSSGEN